MFNAASKNSVYDTMHKLDKHGFARSIAYSTADKTVFMAIDMNNNEGEIVGSKQDSLYLNIYSGRSERWHFQCAARERDGRRLRGCRLDAGQHLLHSEM